MKDGDDGKQKGRNLFTGKKLAYGATILYLVSKELKLNIDMKDIVEASVERKDELDTNSLKIAKKNLQKVFKNWFRSGNTPQSLIPKFTDELDYPQDLKDDALYIVEGVHRELESCHPLTVVGVALFMVNSRMPAKFIEHKRSEQEISDLIGRGRGLNNIKEKHERIKSYEKNILPPHYFQSSRNDHRH